MIRGELVTLRAIERADYARLAAFADDLELLALASSQVPVPSPLERIGERLDQRLHDVTAVSFAVEVGVSLIGVCGLSNIDRVNGTAEVGVFIGDRTWWGKGYGSDTVVALVRYAFLSHNLRRVWLQLPAGNERAIKCYRSVGFIEEGWLRQHVWSAGEYVDLVLLGLMRDDWEDILRPAQRPRHLNVTDDTGW